MSTTAATPWLDYLVRHIGLKEIPGPQHNPTIVKWGKDAGIDWWNNDEDAWCAVAVNGALVNTGFPSTKSALARSFLDYGMPLAEPVPGAIVVFARGPNPVFGHVGIVETVHKNGTITIVNGNVDDELKRSVFRIASILPGGIRWPTEKGDRAAPTLGSRVLRIGMSGPDVESWQAALDLAGYHENDPEIAFFGEDTEDATRAFQRDQNLKRDGVVGRATMAAMTEVLSKKGERREAEKNAAPAATIGTAIGAGATAVVVDTVRAAREVSDAATGAGPVFAALIVAALAVGAYFLWRRYRGADA